MKADFTNYIKLAFNDELDMNSTKLAFSQIMNNNVNEIQISSFLSLLQKSGIKSHHLIGALEIMQSKMISIISP